MARQKLYRSEAGSSGDYPNVQHILTRPINWDLVRKQYDETTKYTTAVAVGSAL